MSENPTEPAPKKKHGDVQAMARIADILDKLDEDERQRTLAWVRAKYPEDPAKVVTATVTT